MGLLTGYFSLIGYEDGIGYEEIYRLTSSSTTPSTPSSSNTNGAVPSGWYSTPQSVSRSYPYQWVSKRSKVDGNWGVWSTPVEYNRFVEDAKTYEYCYKATQYNSTPSTPTSSNVDGSVPSGWSATPPDISAVNAYVWESQRKKSKGSWGSWSTPKLKNRWANDGAQGGKGAKMRMRTWASGVRYLQGAEGEEFYDIVVYETKLYLCTKTHTSSSSNNPVKSIGSYLGYWESAQQWTFIATQLLLAGKIVSDKITADLIDADGITATDVDISGKITATSGKIGGFLIDSSSIKSENGNIQLHSDGSVRLNGDIQLRGFYKSLFTLSSYKTLSSGIRIYYFEKDTRTGYSNVGFLIPEREGDKFLLPNDTEYYGTYFYVYNYGSYSISPFAGGDSIPVKGVGLYFASYINGSNIAWCQVAISQYIILTANPEDIG